jgi:hypothetical protein
MRLYMVDNVPCDIVRFVSSHEFNNLSLTVPYIKGPNIKVLVRHGQAYHNLSAPELQKLWDAMTIEKQTMYLNRSTKRISTEIWQTLTPERQMVLTLQELRYDAPLTEKGQEEAKQASAQLRAYLQKHYPRAYVRVHASELWRAYETGAILLAMWSQKDCSFSFDSIIYASLPYLNELHREIGSVVHMLGTTGRHVAETLGLNWIEYAQHILKNPISRDAIYAMTTEEQQEVRDKVVHITSENIPMPKEERPTTLHGVDVEHGMGVGVIRCRNYPCNHNHDLFCALPGFEQ